MSTKLAQYEISSMYVQYTDVNGTLVCKEVPLAHRGITMSNDPIVGQALDVKYNVHFSGNVTKKYMLITPTAKGWEDSDLWRGRTYIGNQQLLPLQTVSGKVAVMWANRDLYDAFVYNIRWWYRYGIQFQFKYY